jgi:hypothetical protein
MKVDGRVAAEIQVFSTSALVRSWWSASAPGKELPGPQSRSGRREEENLVDPTGTSAHSRSLLEAHNSVALSPRANYTD